MYLVFLFVLGPIILWIVGRFSAEQPSFVQCFIGAVIIEVSRLFLGDFLSLIAAVVVCLKICNISGLYAYFAATLYSILLYGAGTVLTIMLA